MESVGWVFVVVSWYLAILSVLFIPFQLLYGKEVFGYSDIGPEHVAQAKAECVAALADLYAFRRQHGLGNRRLGSGR